jgi:hypothetical protein
VFKGEEQVEMFPVGKQSAYLIGRDRIVSCLSPPSLIQAPPAL